MSSNGTRLMSVRAGGLDDPDASRAGALVGAYLTAQHASGFRGRVLRSAAVGVLAIWALNSMTSALTRVDIVFAAALIGTAVVAALVAEVRARSRFGSLLARTHHP